MDEGKATGGAYMPGRLVRVKRGACSLSFNALDGEYGVSAYTFLLIFNY